jgi:hypothetical protein
VLIVIATIWVVVIPAVVIAGAWAVAIRRGRNALRPRVPASFWIAGPHRRPLIARGVPRAPRVRRGCESSGRPRRTRARGV